MSFALREERLASRHRPPTASKPGGPHAGPETFFVSRYQSPLGTYLLVSSRRGLVSTDPEEQGAARLARWERQGVQFQEGGGHNRVASQELDQYFAGRLRAFSVPLDMRGTAFQRQAWEQLRAIPYGETRSYGQQAGALGRPTASRAVGRANGTNPLSIVVPCHRVIRSGGQLGGYGGGLDRKRALLDLEARVLRGEGPPGLP